MKHPGSGGFCSGGGEVRAVEPEGDRGRVAGPFGNPGSVLDSLLRELTEGDAGWVIANLAGKRGAKLFNPIDGSGMR